ncbi:restriction endonuclease [Mobilicoccus massiliensis]|uniref:restriction endonuclease n=1 Tax=Mobilicoccus massiliensis TaxID=1522310 RepID=UPI00058EDEBC|nr:restriction endonuclease [Mobilicoccus massiliensis]
MSAWVVRAGMHGEAEEFNLGHSVASVGWPEIGDLSSCTTRDAVASLVAQAYPEMTASKLAAATGQLWAFSHSIRPGDVVVMPLKTQRGMLTIGRCTGRYRYDGSQPVHHRHLLPAEWRTEPVARVVIKDDLLASLNAIRTVFNPTRNQAENRLVHVLEHGTDPGLSGVTAVPDRDENVADPDPVPTLEAIRDRVRTHVAENFAEHKLTHLVAEVLETMGFHCEVSPAGPDGGVDILAGSGPLGLDSPTLVVEVKSEPTPVGSAVVRGLHSAMTRYDADQGLLVALGGTTTPAQREFSTLRTRLRVWDADTFLDHLFDRYEMLPALTRQKLPLTRAWVLDDPSE